MPDKLDLLLLLVEKRLLGVNDFNVVHFCMNLINGCKPTKVDSSLTNFHAQGTIALPSDRTASFTKSHFRIRNVIYPSGLGTTALALLVLLAGEIMSFWNSAFEMLLATTNISYD